MGRVFSGGGSDYIACMAHTSTQDWSRLAQNRSLSGLMNLYESNFQRLARLIPGFRLPRDRAESRTEQDGPLYLEVLERCPYTLTLILTYRLAQAGEVPRLRVRIYFDAQVAQAMDAEPAAAGENIDRQWERNLLLNKWLEFCLHHGHGFVARAGDSALVKDAAA